MVDNETFYKYILCKLSKIQAKIQMGGKYNVIYGISRKNVKP